MEAGRAEPGSLGRHHQLFLLWIRGVDLLRMVLPLPGQGARARSEGERALLHAALYGNAGLLFVGRPVE